MNDSPRVEQARVAVEKILLALQVARVVCVDDIYLDEPPVEDVVVAASSLETGILQKVLPELGDSIPDDQDVLKEKVRRLWDVLDKPVRRDRAKDILAAVQPREGEVTDSDSEDASTLSQLMPREMFLTLSPEQWEEQRTRLLEENRERRTLFLFDQNLSKRGGDREGGIKIIASLLARDDAGKLICGLLTQMVAPENQLQMRDELSNAHGIPRDLFLVISKQHLRQDPVLFAQLLKLVALSPDFASLMLKVKNIIDSAAAAASNNVEAINIYDLDHIVFQATVDEGLWEPDMLFRLHALFHRLESRRLAHEGGELEAIASRLRSVSHIATKASHPLASTTWEIQRKELYELPDYLNRYHLPLELGDIFAKTEGASTTHYILLAQPCDLMVRPRGERKPNIAHVPLAKIAAIPDSSRSLSRYEEEMAYFGDSPNQRWCVKVKQVYQVHIDILDLCVFNDDGSATMRPDREAPNGIRPAWKARYLSLANSFRSLSQPLELLSPVAGDSQDVTAFKAKHKSQLTDAILKEGLFKGRVVDEDGHRGIAYNCRRVGRLSLARSFGLLMAYTACLGRSAYDLAFG